jgi:uncharacterized protein YutE (UPF0331/DUF86 family)
MVESSFSERLREFVVSSAPPAGFRNVLVHGYQDVDLGVVEDVLRNHLDDLLAFVTAIRPRLQ